MSGSYVEIAGSGKLRATTRADVKRAKASRLQAMGDPLPGPATPASLSHGPGWYDGRLRLVGSMGQARQATYLQVYRFNPWLYAGVNQIARGVSRLPIHTYQFDADGNKTRIRSDIPQTPGRPLAAVGLDRILTIPADGISRQAMYGATMRDRLIYGNALWEILRDGGGVPTGLRRIQWRRVTHIEEDSDGEPLWYTIAPNTGFATTRNLLPQDVVHFGLSSDVDRCWNISLLESCQHTLALHEAIMRHLLSYMENSARPSGSFKAESAKAAREARELITELYTSPENAGKVLVTNATWQAMSDNPQHAQLVELVKESRTEIAAALQIPPTELGILDHAIRANVAEMREKFGRDTIGVWANEFEGELEAQLISPVPSWAYTFSEFQLAEMLRPDLEARALVYQRLMWIYSVDEIRGFENRPPFNIKGVTDVPWVQSGAMPLTTAAQGKARVATVEPDALDDPNEGEPAAMLVGLARDLAADRAMSLEDAAKRLAALHEVEEQLEHTSNGHRELSEVT